MTEHTEQGSLSASARYFFDITGLVDFLEKNKRYSGIQRVLTTVVDAFADLVPPDQLYLTWYNAKKKSLECAPLDAFGRDNLGQPETMQQAFYPGKTNSHDLPMLQRYRDTPWKFALQRTRLDLLGLLGRDRNFRRYGITAADWGALRKPIRAGMERPKGRVLRDVARAGDRFILLDLSNHARHIDAYKAAKAQGLTVFTLIHDLIPLVRPEFSGAYVSVRFYEWMKNTLDFTDGYLANSKATRRDLANFLVRHHRNIPIHTLPLAQAGLIPNAAKGQGSDSTTALRDTYPEAGIWLDLDDTHRAILSGSFALCVGTLETRKNIWRIMMAWKALLDSGETRLPKIVFAGKRGDLLGDFTDVMAATGNLYGYAQFVETPSDDLLDILYKRCDFTILASHYEGWGLPVGEALAYGKTAVVSEASSLPEVGQDMVTYCDPTDIASIAEAIRKMLDPHHRTALQNKIAQAKLRSWADVANDLKTATSGV